jgi:hypothetical protein
LLRGGTNVRRLAKFVFIIFCLIVAYHIWDEYFTSNNRIQKSIASPDNKYIAYIFTRDFGATTRESYNLSILKKGKVLRNTSGNIYISYGKFEVEWVKPDELKVIGQNEKVFKRVAEFEDVQITYSN